MRSSKTFGAARWAGLYSAAAVLSFLGAAEIPLIFVGHLADPTVHGFRALLFLTGALILGITAHIYLRRHERDGGHAGDDHPRP